jgi:hypothetical protein
MLPISRWGTSPRFLLRRHELRETFGPIIAVATHILANLATKRYQIEAFLYNLHGASV